MQLEAQWSKLITIILVSLGAILLGVLGKISSDSTVALLSGCMGYVFGNGHGILSAQRANQPAVSPVRER